MASLQTPILHTIAALTENEITAYEAVTRLRLFGAADWVIDSVVAIERQAKIDREYRTLATGRGGV